MIEEQADIPNQLAKYSVSKIALIGMMGGLKSDEYKEHIAEWIELGWELRSTDVVREHGDTDCYFHWKNTN